MRDFPMPVDETRRQSILDATDALGADLWPELDALTAEAAERFGTPISAVSLVDRDRQFFKSCLGLTTRKTERRVAFCAHTIMSDKPMVVENAEDDERFANNPLVTGAPDIRFYAGAPIKVAGANIGSFCVIGREPRGPLSPEELKVLTGLAREASEIIEDRMPRRSDSA